MEELIKRLKAMVKYETESQSPDDPNDRSWGMQTGIIISTNEARAIIEYYEQLIKQQ